MFQAVLHPQAGFTLLQEELYLQPWGSYTPEGIVSTTIGSYTQVWTISTTKGSYTPGGIVSTTIGSYTQGWTISTTKGS